MAKTRARLTEDNDPLSPTDQVLSGMAQASKSASQPARKSTRTKKVTTQQSDKPTSQELAPVTDIAADKSTSQEAEPVTTESVASIQQANNLTSQEAETLTSESVAATQEANKLESQQVESKTLEESSPSPKYQVNKTDSQQVNLSESQPVKLKKTTFKINETVLEALDRLHLQLQLERGKANAPYKEVIVEEALCQFLTWAASNPEGLIEVLGQRQQGRK